MDDKLEQIIESTAELFSQKGIRCISMDDISKHLKISKKTLYQFVKNKRDLLEKISDYYSAEFCRNMKRVLEQKLNAIDVLFAVSQLLSRHWQRYTPSLSCEMNKYYPEISERISEIQNQQTYSGVIQNLNQGIDEGLYRTDVNIEITAQIYIKKIKDLHDPETFDPKMFTTNTIFEVMFENHIRGIANEKGIKYFEEKLKKNNIDL